MPSGMTFTTADVLSDEFWEELKKGKAGKYGHLPPPDIVSASPPCNGFTRLPWIGGSEPTAPLGKDLVDRVVGRLHALQQHRKMHGEPDLVWQVENVPESEKYTSTKTQKVHLCGTMMGHHVFRHRVFYCNYTAETPTGCRHKGKVVGS